MNEKSLLKGDIYMVKTDFNKPPIGSEMWSDRPAVIVSNDINNKTSNVVQIVYLTSSHRRRLSPMHVELTTQKEHSIAMCEQIHTVDISRLENYISHITDKELIEIDQALTFCLGIEQKNYNTLFRKWDNYIRKNKINFSIEQERLIETTENTAIKNLRKEVEILTSERDSYKTLSQTNEIRYEELLKQIHEKID